MEIKQGQGKARETRKYAILSAVAKWLQIERRDVVHSRLCRVGTFGVRHDPENRIAKQKEAFRAVFGKWRDSRSTDEIVSEIEGARTPGRKVEL